MEVWPLLRRFQRSAPSDSTAPLDESTVRQPTGSNATRYAAFISYSRAVDGKLAPALQSALQRFAKPWYQRQALRVFRDDASLAANPGLWPSIQDALDASEFFILLASPKAASSEGVQRETDYWLDQNPQTNLFIALTDWHKPRDPASEEDPASEDFDWHKHKTTVLPPSLAGKLTDEPRYVDLRWVGTEEHLSLRDPRFRDCVADLAAPLHHQAKDDLIGEEVRQHRRHVRQVRIVIAVLAFLAILAVTAAVVAVQQRQAALLQLDIATSRQLAATAESKASSDPQLATLLSVTAFDAKDTPEARIALVHQLDRLQHIDRFLSAHTGPVRRVAFSPDGRTLVATGEENSVLWDITKGTRLATLPDAGGEVAFSPDGRTLVAAGEKSVVLWDVAQRRQLATLPGVTNAAGGNLSIALSPNGRTLAIGGVDYTKIVLWDVAKRRQLATLTYSIPGQTVPAMGGFVLAFSPDGRTLAADGPKGGDITLWDVAKRTPVANLRGGHTRGIFSLAFSPDGRTIASGGHDAKIVLWDVAQRKQLATLNADGDVN